MTDALTDAERLLREDCELRYEATGRCPAGDGACSRCVTADALAAERERRGPTRQQVVDVLERYRRMAWDGAEKNAIVAVGQSVLGLFTAAPPLPPATGEDDGELRWAWPMADGTGIWKVTQWGPGCFADMVPKESHMHRDAKPFLVYVKRADGHSSARPTPEPSEAMVEAAGKALRAMVVAVDAMRDDGRSAVPQELENAANALRAALAAQEGE